MKLEVMKKCCSLYRLDENREIPGEIYQSDFFFVAKSDKELSIICDADVNMSCCTKIEQLKLLRVDDVIDFDKIGVISSISDCFTKNGIPLLAESSFDTIYIVVKKVYVDTAIKALTEAGFDVQQ